MYPTLFNGLIESYIVMVCIGIVAALVMFRIITGKVGMDERSFRFYGLIIIVAIVSGFGFARLFQMLYNFIETGSAGTGITFLGGLVGGVGVFFLLALFFGKKFKASLFSAVNLTMPCIAFGHFFGRIGCFLAGCCYGAETNSFIGMTFVDKVTPSGEWVYFQTPRLPTQLIEAVFLLLLSISLLIFIFRFGKLDFAAMIYMYSYGVFRFLLEFLRDDPRGAFILGLSPSQIICILMVIGAVILNIVLVKRRRHANDNLKQPSTEPENI